MVKEKPQIEESEKEIAMRKEFRKEWSEIEPKLVEMAFFVLINGYYRRHIIPVSICAAESIKF